MDQGSGSQERPFFFHHSIGLAVFPVSAVYTSYTASKEFDVVCGHPRDSILYVNPHNSVNTTQTALASDDIECVLVACVSLMVSTELMLGWLGLGFQGRLFSFYQRSDFYQSCWWCLISMWYKYGQLHDQ